MIEPYFIKPYSLHLGPRFDFKWDTDDDTAYLPEKYIINEHVAVLFWDGCNETITRSYRNEKDAFDKELGFLIAFFKYHFNGSNQSQKNVINSVSDLKTFMFEYFVEKTGWKKEKARKYLADLKIEERKPKK